MDREKDSLTIDDLKFDDAGLIPVVVQQHDTLEVLMVAYMNREAIAKTLQTGRTWFWSRSRQEYWMKGESSGHVQAVKKVLYDCDADCLLVLVDQTGVACHTGARTCFYRSLELSKESTSAQLSEPQSLEPQLSETLTFEPHSCEPQHSETHPFEPHSSDIGEVLCELYSVLEQRKQSMPEGSYTAKLLQDHEDKLLKKIGEEATEVVMAAKDGDIERLRYEIGDLVYHLLVVMLRAGLTLEDVAGELAERRRA